jgi:hypothetical protein
MRFKRLILFILIGISTFDAFSQSREAGIAIGLMLLITEEFRLPMKMQTISGAATATLISGPIF